MHNISPALPSRAQVRERSGAKWRFRAGVSLLVATALATSTVASITSVTSVTWAASADSPGVVSIEVLGFASNDAVDEASALTDAFKHALVGAPGVADHGKSHALEAVALTVGCDDPMVPACAPKIAAEIKHDRFIYGVVKKTPPNKITATLHYYDAGKVKTVAKTYDAGPMAKDGTSPELKKIALDALFSLIGGAPKGAVAVNVTGPAGTEDGELYEGTTKIGTVTAGKGTVELPSGPHTVVLRVKGYAETTGNVDVTPNGTTLDLAPVKLPPSKPFDWQLYSGVGAITVGAVFVAVGVATSLSVYNAKDDPTFVSYRNRFPKSEGDTCAQARAGKESPDPNATVTTPLAGEITRFCDDVSSKQTQQFIWYGIGGALVVGGTILILTRSDKDKEEAKTAYAKTGSGVQVEVRPIVSPTMQVLSLVGTF